MALTAEMWLTTDEYEETSLLIKNSINAMMRSEVNF